MQENYITSRSNALIKKITGLQNKKQREKENLIWVEGLKCVQTLLASDYEVELVLVDNNAQNHILDYVADLDCDVIYAEEHCFNKCSALKNPEGIGAVAKMPVFDRLPSQDDAGTTLVLWQIADPGNLGCLIRTAAGLGVNSIIIVEPSVDVFNPMTIRGSTGAIFFADIHIASPETILGWLRYRKESVAGLTGDGEILLSEVKTNLPKILLIGNEPHGLPVEVRQEFSGIRLPMQKNVESLNVSTASAIAIYTLWPQVLEEV